MKTFEEKASAEELWDYCRKEYENNNFFVRFAINKFFRSIGDALQVLDSDDAVLEVGCGAGESSFRIKKLLSGQRFEVSDIDERYVSKLKKINPPFAVSRESIYSLQRRDNEFACVMALEVLEHLERPEEALEQLFRVSKKSVIISVPNEPIWRLANMARGKYLNRFGDTPGHVNHWSAGKIKNLVLKYGKIVKIYKPIPWLIIVVQK